MGVSGTFDEVAAPTRLVSTEQFDDFPGPSVNTMLLAAVGDDRTAMTLDGRLPRPGDPRRLGRLRHDRGPGRGYDRLDDVLTTMG